MDKIKARIIIASDSHRDCDVLTKIANYENKINKGYELVFLLAGDSEEEAFMIEPFISVKGNCDYREDYPSYLIIPVHKHRIFMTHGHMYSNMTINDLMNDNRCDICITGHTHSPVNYEANGKRFINPGSVSRPRNGSKRNYLEMDIMEDGCLKFYTKFIEEID